MKTVGEVVGDSEREKKNEQMTSQSHMEVPIELEEQLATGSSHSPHRSAHKAKLAVEVKDSGRGRERSGVDIGQPVIECKPSFSPFPPLQHPSHSPPSLCFRCPSPPCLMSLTYELLSWRTYD
jgi:hypothetical protein